VSVKQEPLAGMTLNERLYSRGLLERFDEARATEDREELRAILTQLEVSNVDWVLDQLIASKPETDI
jgi:hypothetical protein